MEKMWSPWRSQYIQSFKTRSSEEDACVFCTASTQSPEDEESLVVYKDEKAFVVMNLYPYNNGHLMIVPNRHMSDFLEIASDEMSEITELLRKSVEALKQAVSPQGFNIGLNMGKAAGAGIDRHLHFHIVPRWNGDTNFMPALGEVKIISQDLIELKQKLVAAFRNL